MTFRYGRKLAVLTSMMILALVSFSAAAPSARAENRSFKLYTVEIDGVKFWLPSTIVVKKGDKVKLEVASKLTGASATHGLDLPEFKIKDVIDNKGKTYEFTADKAGIFPYTCHLHPGHVGGEIIVLE